MKRIGKILRVIGKAMKLIFIAFCIYTGSLLFRQQELPAEWIEDRLQERLPENLVLHLGGGSFGFRDGLTLTDIKLYDKARKDALSPMVAVERASINLLTVIAIILIRSRDRQIMKRRMIDGICYEPLAEEFDLSTVQVKRIVRRERSRILKLIQE